VVHLDPGRQGAAPGGRERRREGFDPGPRDGDIRVEAASAGVPEQEGIEIQLDLRPGHPGHDPDVFRLDPRYPAQRVEGLCQETVDVLFFIRCIELDFGLDALHAQFVEDRIDAPEQPFQASVGAESPDGDSGLPPACGGGETRSEDPDVQRKEIIVQGSDPERRPAPTVQLALDGFPDKRLVEPKNTQGQDQEDEDRAANGGRDSRGFFRRPDKRPAGRTGEHGHGPRYSRIMGERQTGAAGSLIFSSDCYILPVPSRKGLRPWPKSSPSSWPAAREAGSTP